MDSSSTCLLSSVPIGTASWEFISHYQNYQLSCLLLLLVSPDIFSWIKKSNQIRTISQLDPEGILFVEGRSRKNIFFEILTQVSAWPDDLGVMPSTIRGKNRETCLCIFTHFKTFKAHLPGIYHKKNKFLCNPPLCCCFYPRRWGEALDWTNEIKKEFLSNWAFCKKKKFSLRPTHTQNDCTVTTLQAGLVRRQTGCWNRPLA